jgi:hypothetical protein
MFKGVSHLVSKRGARKQEVDVHNIGNSSGMDIELELQKAGDMFQDFLSRLPP